MPPRNLSRGFFDDFAKFSADKEGERQLEFAYRCTREAAEALEVEVPAMDGDTGDMAWVVRNIPGFPLRMTSLFLKKPFNLAAFLTSPRRTPAWTALMGIVDESESDVGIVFPSRNGTFALHNWWRSAPASGRLRIQVAGDSRDGAPAFGVVLEKWADLLAAVRVKLGR